MYPHFFIQTLKSLISQKLYHIRFNRSARNMHIRCLRLSSHCERFSMPLWPMQTINHAGRKLEYNQSVQPSIYIIKIYWYIFVLPYFWGHLGFLMCQYFNFHSNMRNYKKECVTKRLMYPTYFKSINIALQWPNKTLRYIRVQSSQLQNCKHSHSIARELVQLRLELHFNYL